MLRLRNFWSKHKRKVLVSVGILGSGYVLYKLYDGHRQKIEASEREIERQHEAEERIRAQLQASFLNIQRISDTTTLPSVMHDLRSRISEELDLTELREQLNQGRNCPNVLTAREKLDVWEKLKILSFTKTMTSLWAMTMLNLYVRVLHNVLGRHLYVDTARGLLSIEWTGEADSLDRLSHHEFLSSADYLGKSSLSALIFDLKRAVSDVLKDKQLTESFSMTRLYDTILQMLGSFKDAVPDPHHWVPYLLPDSATLDHPSASSSADVSGPTTKLEQLIAETRFVLASDEFSKMVELSLKEVVGGLMEEMKVQVYSNIPSSSSGGGIPLVKLVPRIIELGNHLLEDSTKNIYVRRIQSLPELDLLCKILYSGAPIVSKMHEA